MAYFWLYDGINTLNIDDTVSEFEVSSIKRDFDVDDYMGSHGGVIVGTGNLKSRKYSITRKERRELGDATAWNTRRQTYLIFFLKNKYKDIWLYVKNSAGTTTMRTKIYCQDIGSEKYKSLSTSGEREISVISPDGYLENVSITDTALSEDLTGYNVISVSTINSMLDIPAIWTMTPAALVTIIKVWITESIGFTLEGSFLSGKTIIYNHLNNTLKIGGNLVDIGNYLTSGGRFGMPPDTTEINFYSDDVCDITFSYYERFI